MEVQRRSENSSTVKVTLEIDQGTNLNELMAHLSMMRENTPRAAGESADCLPDFSIHEGELEPADGHFGWDL